MTERFRFEGNKVFEYSAEHKAYVYAGSRTQVGTKLMSKQAWIEKHDEDSYIEDLKKNGYFYMY